MIFLMATLMTDACPTSCNSRPRRCCDSRRRFGIACAFTMDRLAMCGAGHITIPPTLLPKHLPFFWCHRTDFFPGGGGGSEGLPPPALGCGWWTEPVGDWVCVAERLVSPRLVSRHSQLSFSLPNVCVCVCVCVVYVRKQAATTVSNDGFQIISLLSRSKCMAKQLNLLRPYQLDKRKIKKVPH